MNFKLPGVIFKHQTGEAGARLYSSHINILGGSQVILYMTLEFLNILVTITIPNLLLLLNY